MTWSREGFFSGLQVRVLRLASSCSDLLFFVVSTIQVSSFMFYSFYCRVSCSRSNHLHWHICFVKWSSVAAQWKVENRLRCIYKLNFNNSKFENLKMLQPLSFRQLSLRSPSVQILQSGLWMLLFKRLGLETVSVFPGIKLLQYMTAQFLPNNSRKITSSKTCSISSYKTVPVLS